MSVDLHIAYQIVRFSESWIPGVTFHRDIERLAEKKSPLFLAYFYHIGPGCVDL